MKEVTAYKRRSNAERRSPRHAFLFQVPGQKPAKVWAAVKPATTEVVIYLTEDHILRAIKLEGFADAQNCAGAVCAKQHGNSFPHRATGHFDWLYRRLYVSDANDKLGLPKSCIAYRHNSDVAQLFDTKAGLKKLLARVRKHGPIAIRLSPPIYWEREKGRPAGNPEAPQRRKIGTGALGHKLRMTKWKAGWFKDAMLAATQ